MKRGRPALSPWIDGSVRPVRVGVYQIIVPGLAVRPFSYWAGSIWFAYRPTAQLAAYEWKASGQQRPIWRGRAERAR